MRGAAPRTQLQSASSPDTTAAHRLDAVQLTWRILTAPRTVAVLAALVGAVLFAGAIVPQGLDRLELLGRYPVHVVVGLRAFGLDEVFTSWLFLLTVLLLALSAAGLALRVGLARRGARSEDASHGPLTERVEATLRDPLPTLSQRLPTALGGARTSLRHAQGRVSARRGLHPEGLALVALGVLALLAALAINRTAALDARVVLDTGHAAVEDANLRVSIRDGDLRIDRAPPFLLFCAAPDPLDPARRQRCSYARPGAEPVDAQLTPGRSTEVDGITFTPVAQRRLGADGRAPFSFLVRGGEGGPARLAAEAGATVRLPAASTSPDAAAPGDASHALTAFPGPDGPLVVFAGVGERPVLLGPRVGASPSTASATPLDLAWLPNARVTIAAATHPERYLVWAGVALVLLGLLAMALLPDLRVELRARDDDATQVTITSANRAGSAHALLARLHGVAAEAAGSHEASGSSAPSAPPTGASLPRFTLVAGATLALAALALAVGALSGDPTGGHAVLAGGAVLGFGGVGALWLAAFAVLVALGTPPDVAAPLPWWLAAPGALALGALTRAAEPAARYLIAPSRRVAAATLLASLLAITLLLSDGYALLADPSGGTLAFDAILRDGLTAGRSAVSLPALVPHTQPGHVLGGVIALFAGVAAFGLLAWRASDRAELARPAWLLAALAGGLAALFALTGLLELLVGAVALPDAEALRAQLTFEAGLEASLERVSAPPTAALALWSRPVIDGVRLLLGAALVLLALRGLRGPADSSAASAVALRAVAPRWAPLAAALCAAMAPFSPLPIALALAATATLVVGALVAGRLGAPRDALPAGLLVAGAVSCVAAWVGPLAGWFAA